MYFIYTIVTTSFVRICTHISVHWMHAAHLVASIRGNTHWNHKSKWSTSESQLFCCTSALCQGLQVANTHYTLPACLIHQLMNVHYWCSVYIRQCCFSCAGSVVLTQTHSAAPYVCRTGNITLRCQYDGVENVLGVVWVIGTETTPDPSTIPGHTALPRTTTYQEVVVDSYTNLAAGYDCTPTLSNGTQLESNLYMHATDWVWVYQTKSILLCSQL